jgi:hypothetical protein
MFHDDHSHVAICVALQSKQDPQRLDREQFEFYEFVKPWYESISKLNLNGLIFHDFDNVEQYETDKIKLWKIDEEHFLKSPYTVNDYRFLLVNKHIDSIKYKKILMTDCNDVIIPKNPFDFMDDENKIYVGSELQTAKESKWCRRQFGAAYGAGFPYWDNIVLNCGIIGGHYKTFKEYYADMSTEIYSVGPDYKRRTKLGSPSALVDMSVINYILHSPEWRDRVVTGEPFHSKWKKYETHRTDVCVIHK